MWFDARPQQGTDAVPAPGFHHQLAISAAHVKLDALVDDVLIAAPVPEVAPAEPTDVLCQTIARHRVRDHCTAWVLPVPKEKIQRSAVTS